MKFLHIETLGLSHNFRNSLKKLTETYTPSLFNSAETDEGKNVYNGHLDDIDDLGLRPYSQILDLPGNARDDKLLNKFPPSLSNDEKKSFVT